MKRERKGKEKRKKGGRERRKMVIVRELAGGRFDDKGEEESCREEGLVNLLKLENRIRELSFDLGKLGRMEMGNPITLSNHQNLICTFPWTNRLGAVR